MRVGLLHLGRTAAGPQLTLELARAMISVGHEPAVVFSANAEIASELGDLPVPTLPVRTFDSAIGAVTGLRRLPRAAREIDMFFRTHGVTTIVVTMEQIWQGPILMRLRRGHHVLLFVHDATPHSGEDNPVTRWLRSLERRFADEAIVLSEHVATSLATQGAFDQQQIHRTIHPAFDVPLTVRQRTIRNSSLPVIGFFGRMARYKGLELGAQTMAELRQRGRRISFHVAGRSIPTDIDGLPHADDVLEDRWIPQADVPAVLDRFDIMVLPYTEASQSGVMAYAMALGIPTVVTPVGGLIEQARDSGCAVVATNTDALALADSIERLLDDESLYAQLSEAGLAASATHYSWARTARDVLDASR